MTVSGIYVEYGTTKVSFPQITLLDELGVAVVGITASDVNAMGYRRYKGAQLLSTYQLTTPVDLASEGSPWQEGGILETSNGIIRYDVTDGAFAKGSDGADRLAPYLDITGVDRISVDAYTLVDVNPFETETIVAADVQLTTQETANSFTFEYYGTVPHATSYFSRRLHEKHWTKASHDDRVAALIQATSIIDALAYKGEKNAAWALATNASSSQIREANLSQKLEFPRDSDTSVPNNVLVACYEIAHELLGGVDPQMELELLDVTSTGFGSARTTYNRNKSPQDRLIAGVPSATAWNILQPYLRDGEDFRLRKV